MDNYIKIQNDLSSRIVKAMSNFRKSPKDRIKLSYIETRLEALQQQWESFTNNHRSLVYEAKPEELEKTSYFSVDLYEQTEETYVEYKSILRETLANLNSVSSSVSKGNEQPTKPNVKLPEISLPKFSGKYTEWVSFRDMFVSLIHKNGTIDDVQKLHYLKGALIGEAENLLRHISISAENYKTSWKKLENRYNNKKYLSNAILKRLLGQKVLLSESANGLKQLLDVTKECLNALQNLGINTSSWDLIVIHIISQKLDPDSRERWDTKISESSLDLPTFPFFEEFLETRFRSLEYKDSRVQKQEKSNVTHVATTIVNCMFCSENHKLFNCKKFAKESTDARRKFVQTHHLCFNCFSSDHSVYQCTLSARCRLCKRKHHSLLHPKTHKSVGDQDKPDQSVETNVVATVTEASTSSQGLGESSNSEIVTTYFSKAEDQVLLATALVNAESRKGSAPVVLRSLLDQGSQASFITESAVQLLGLRKVPEISLVSGLGQGQTLTSKSAVSIRIVSRRDPSFSLTVKVHVLEKLTTLLPNRKVVVNLLSALPPMELADPAFDTPSRIDLLLGADVFSEILMQGFIKGPPGSVIAQQTRLGWILSGRAQEDPNCSNGSQLQCSSHNVIVNMHITESGNDLLRKFWELDSEPSSSKSKHLTEEEKRCEELFSKTTFRDDSGRYCVKLPFKTEDPLCQYGGSKGIARHRFLMLEKRLIKNPTLKVEYSQVLNEYLSMGHMEVVNSEDMNNPKAVYLPHHAVVRENKTTTKVRVVFDASCAGTNGVSLNNDLMIGPSLQPELRHLVMRWRRYPIAMVADIVKMYRQVKVTQKDADFQRILWREDPNAELQHFRLLRVTFGTSSAPYLAVRCLQQVASDEGSKFPVAAPIVLNEFYMDDLMTGCHSIEEGQRIYGEVTEMLNLGGFPLQKWTSNSRDLMMHLNKNSTESENSPSLELKTDEIMKILGLIWDRESDEFRCTVNLPQLESPVTKRKVISDIARLFDPLGWIAPVITTAKVFIQKIWLSGIDWDGALPASLLREWIIFRNELSKLTEIRVPRWINSSKDDLCLELHGFSDASNVAYAAVVFARIIDASGNTHVNLITSKTRVAPIKQVSVPRLELCGAVLMAKLLEEVSKTLDVPKKRLHAWTDSTIVLAWLSSHPSRWKTFIGNRVSEILTILDADQWSHVVSKENPADCASRGISPAECVHNKLWYQGPDWLYHKEVNYRRSEVKDTNLEERKSFIKCQATIKDSDNILERFSSLKRLTRVVSFCRRVLRWRKSGIQKTEREGTWLTAQEIQESLFTCVKICQGQCFEEDITNLQKTGKVKKNSKLTSLNPFLDANKILRVGGRLHNASIHEDMKHPIIIPHKSHFTTLLIDEAHSKTLHGGPQIMLNYLRSRYWIIDAKGLVRQFFRKCVTCVRHSNQVNQQMMGRLPSARITVNRPFRKCGVDYAGPISVRTTKGRGHRSTKGYICLFVCMVTRAIHLEVVSDMTAQGFLAAFKRFVARRGHVAEIWSDNGTTFVGSARELKHLFDVERSHVAAEIADWLSSNGTDWHFIPPHSPNFGGLWEAGIKSTKHHLKRVLGTSTLTFEEMITTLAQIEACLNSRPISQLSNNPEDLSPLTPGHFLVGEPLVLVPDVNYESANISSLRRWHLTQRMVQDFWRRWSQEYLTQLQHRYKWSEQMPEPGVGDVVLVKEDDLPPARWLLGRIVEKHQGLDNLTRVVTLKYKGNIIKRPVSKLILLPVTK